MSFSEASHLQLLLWNYSLHTHHDGKVVCHTSRALDWTVLLLS